MLQEIADALAQSWRNFATAFAQFVPRLVAATIIFALGFLVAALARRAVARLLAWFGFERLAPGPAPARCCASPRCPAPRCSLAKIVFWLVWIGFIVSAVDALQLQPFQGLVQEFFRFVPRFLVALLVLALGFLIGNFVWRATLLASVNAGVPGARLLSGALRLLVIAVAVVMALEQLRPRHHRRPHGVRHLVRRPDAGARDCVRPGRSRCRPEAARTPVPGAGSDETPTRRRISDRADMPLHDVAAASCSTRPACRDVRHRRSGAERARVRRLPRRGRPAPVAGAAARARPAMAIRRISASPRSPAIRCSSASIG